MIRHGELSNLFDCRDMSRGMQCMDSYVWPCIPEENHYEFGSYYNLLKTFTMFVCHRSPHQEGKWPYD